MKRYKHIYFDLDRTIWDLEKNSNETLLDIYNDNNLGSYFKDADQFIKLYKGINEGLWQEYREGIITKEDLRSKRFFLTLQTVGIEDQELANKMGDYYVNMGPTKNSLFPHAHETLEYLKDKYELHIITNGFKEAQYSKLNNSDLSKYFKKIITSEDAGVQKPKPEIFHYALTVTNAEKSECIMIGDDIGVDIKGAKSFGIDQILFNSDSKEHDEEITYEIKSLDELKRIL